MWVVLFDGLDIDIDRGIDISNKPIAIKERNK